MGTSELSLVTYSGSLRVSVCLAGVPHKQESEVDSSEGYHSWHWAGKPVCEKRGANTSIKLSLIWD